MYQSISGQQLIDSYAEKSAGDINVFARFIIEECIDAAMSEDPGYDIRTDTAGWGKAGRALAAKMIAKRFDIKR